MPSDSEDLLNDDLYGDLEDDLNEDLDATALEEELVDPDEPSQPPALAPAASQPPAPAVQPAAAAPALAAQQAQQPPQLQQQQQQPQYGFGQAGGYQNQNQFGQQQGGPSDSGAGEGRPSDMPDEGKMFIGGLNWETTDDGLKAYMSKYGDISACTIMRDPSGRSRGFAFLTYSNPESVKLVMQETHHLDGKQIDPKRAIPRAEHERTAKVFVGGLAPSVSSESLKVFLSQFGIVMDATVMFDKETNRSKGFAFATFQDEDGVTRAMAASGIELEGKQIEIKRAQPRGSGNLPKQFGNTRPSGFGNNMGGQGGGFGGMGGGFDPNAMTMMYQNMMKNSGMGGMGMGGGFDPNAMAMMYQNMMKNVGGMGNAPAINPNMAMRNGMGGMGMGMGNMGMMGMGMGMGGVANMGMGGGFNPMMGNSNGGGRPIPNAPRGPAAMRSNQGASGSGQATPMAQNGSAQGPGAQRYSTQGSARAKPY